MKRRKPIPVFSFFPKYFLTETKKQIVTARAASRLLGQEPLYMQKDVYSAGKIIGKKRVRYVSPGVRRRGVLTLLTKKGVLFKEFADKSTVYIPKKYGKPKSAFIFPTVHDALMFIRGSVDVHRKHTNISKTIIRLIPKVDKDVFKNFMYLRPKQRIVAKRARAGKEIPTHEAKDLYEFIAKDKSKKIFYHRILGKYGEEKIEKMYFGTSWKELYDEERALAQQHIQVPREEIYPVEVEFVVNFNIEVVQIRKQSVTSTQIFSRNFFFLADVSSEFLSPEIMNYYLYNDFVENHENYITGTFVFVIAFSDADADILKEVGIRVGKKILEETGASEVRFAIYRINELTFAKERIKRKPARVKEEYEEETQTTLVDESGREDGENI